MRQFYSDHCWFCLKLYLADGGGSRVSPAVKKKYQEATKKAYQRLSEKERGLILSVLSTPSGKAQEYISTIKDKDEKARAWEMVTNIEERVAKEQGWI